MSQQESRDHRSSQNASSRGRVQGQPRPNQKSPLTYQCRTRSEQSRVDLYDIYSNAPLRSPLMLTCHAASYTSTTNGIGVNPPEKHARTKNRACISELCAPENAPQPKTPTPQGVTPEANATARAIATILCRDNLPAHQFPISPLTQLQPQGCIDMP